MIIPFDERTKKPIALSDAPTGSFVFLKTLNGKQIIFPLMDVQIETRNNQMIISGKNISRKRGEGREKPWLKVGREASGKEAADYFVYEKHPKGGNPWGERKK